MRSIGGTVRRWYNNFVVAGGLTVTLPVIALTERLRPGAGRRVARWAVRSISRACGVRYTILGSDRLDTGRPYVFVPNHSSAADIPALLLAIADVRFVAAAELFRIPLLAGAMRALGAVPIDRQHPTEARRRLLSLAGATGAASVVVFAEGGIPPRGQRRPFKSGAFDLAIESGLSVVPVSISGSADVLARGRRSVRPGTITVQFHRPIGTASMTAADRTALRDLTERSVRGVMAEAA